MCPVTMVRHAELSLCCPPLIHMLVHKLSTGYPTPVIRYTRRSAGTMQRVMRFFDISISNVIRQQANEQTRTLCASLTKRRAPTSVDRLYPGNIPPIYPFGKQGFRLEKKALG